jgi:hypothetical protein
VADLKEVSEQTADRVKYICNHKVTGRVKIHRILNPEAWESRDTYLRVEGSVTDDSGKETTQPGANNDVYGAVAEAAEQNPKEEKALRDAFSDLVEIQHDLEEDVRFTRASVATLALKPGAGTDGLWQTIRLWQSFVDQRLMSRQNELQRDFQERLHDYLKKEKGLKDAEIPRCESGSDSNSMRLAIRLAYTCLTLFFTAFVFQRYRFHRLVKRTSERSQGAAEANARRAQATRPGVDADHAKAVGGEGSHGSTAPATALHRCRAEASRVEKDAQGDVLGRIHGCV